MKKGWELKRIGDVCDLSTGGTPSRANPEYFDGGNIKWLVSGDIHKREIKDCEGRITQLGLENSNARFLPLNSVMIALNGQGKTRGTVAMLRTQATCNQSLVSISPKNPKVLLSEFLFHNLHGRYDEIRRMTGDDGNDRRGLNMPLIRNIELPIPPIEEQRRIVAILDQAFEAIDKARQNTEKNLQNARELFQAELQRIFANSGDKWRKKSLGEIADIQSGGTPSVPAKGYWNGSIPWYSSGELNETYTCEPERRITELGLNNSNAKLFPKGSLLVGMYDTAALKMSILDRDGTFNQAIAGIKPNDKIDIEFVLHAINSNKPRLLLERRGVRQKNLSLGKIKDISIPFPSLMEQRTTVATLRQILSETQRLEFIFRRKLDVIDELKKSVLHRAFSGEL